MTVHNSVFLLILLAAMFASYRAGKLTFAGTLTGGSVALCIFAGAGYTGIAMLGMFFLLSVLATSYKRNDKRILLNNNEHPDKRGAWQVLANGVIAGGLGLLMCFIPRYAPVFAVLMASALASATADTLSSELGTVYGRRFYNVISLKADEKGRDGVVSLEGTLAGVAGSAVIALVYSIGFGWDITFVCIIIAGTTGNLADSLLGATLERKGYLNNNTVNLFNTLTACAAASLLIGAG